MTIRFLLISFLLTAGWRLGSGQRNLYTFERCKGGQTCAEKRACYIIERLQDSINGSFFPLRNCGALGSAKEAECACLHVGVASGLCNAASNCSLEKTCRRNLKDCDAPNLCVHLLGSNKLDSQLCNHVIKEDKNAECRCATPDEIILRTCESDINCERNQEICQNVTGLEGKRCIGKEPTPLLRRFLPDYTPPPEPCIAVDALQHLSAKDLVYAEHLRSSVLCDHNGSCASPGHIVEYENRFMSMASYCREHVDNGCLKTVRLVNSPRMFRGLRVPSRTTKLRFTALSARYQSQFEELVLSFALRIGL